MSDFGATNIPQLAVAQGNIPLRVNELMAMTSPAAVYGVDPATTTGLVMGWIGGRWGGSLIANGTATLTASTTQYMVVARASGAVTFSTATTNWNDSTTYARAYKLTVGTTAITAGEDHRAGPLGLSTVGYVSVPGLVNWAEAVSTAAPNATVAAVSFTATNAATNVDAVIKAKGTGSLLAQIPDSTSTGGNKRGISAVDWQLSRSAATMVASGANATISGGLNNTASAGTTTVGGGTTNAVSAANGTIAGGTGNIVNAGAGSVGGGDTNTASGGSSTVAGGNLNVASGQYSDVGGGLSNTASGIGAWVGGGQNNVASGDNSSVPGGYFGTTRGIYGMMAYASGRNSAIGDAQRGTYVVRTQTINATPGPITTNGAAASATNSVIMPNNSAYYVKGRVVARRNSSLDASAWIFEGLIKRSANAAATSLVSAITPTLVAQDAGASGWVLAVTADTTLGGLGLTVTGQASATINWTGVVETSEVVG